MSRYVVCTATLTYLFVRDIGIGLPTLRSFLFIVRMAIKGFAVPSELVNIMLAEEKHLGWVFRRGAQDKNFFEMGGLGTLIWTLTIQGMFIAVFWRSDHIKVAKNSI
ncbi:hypothetical protein ACJX0J_013075 [Zea mays]